MDLWLPRQVLLVVKTLVQDLVLHLVITSNRALHHLPIYPTLVDWENL